MIVNPAEPPSNVIENQGTEPPRYAVIFRTHFWDSFAERQLQRLKTVAGHGEIWVLVDVTNRPVNGISHHNIFPVKAADFIAQGFAEAGEGSMMWFNGDYPLYAFRDQHPEYAYYLQLEYDVVINQDLDDLISKACRDAVDFIGLAKGPSSSDWFWRHTCVGAYESDSILHTLICLSLFSGRALDTLKRRRLELSVRWKRGDLVAWPMCEGLYRNRG